MSLIYDSYVWISFVENAPRRLIPYTQHPHAGLAGLIQTSADDSHNQIDPTLFAGHPKIPGFATPSFHFALEASLALSKGRSSSSFSRANENAGRRISQVKDIRIRKVETM